MADPGRCKNCRYFQSQSANPGGEEVSQCHQPELEQFQLEVAGDCGCNAFEARAESWSSRDLFQEDGCSPMMH